MTTLIKYSISFLCGVAVSIGAMYALQPKVKESFGIQVKQIEGATIKHSDYTTKGDNITFITHAEGKGSAYTTISKDSIPESYSYRHHRHSIMLLFGYRCDARDRYAGVMYMYRIGRIYFGGGCDYGNNFFGVKAGAGIWF